MRVVLALLALVIHLRVAVVVGQVRLVKHQQQVLTLQQVMVAQA
jgi:hypothetical protein